MLKLSVLCLPDNKGSNFLVTQVTTGTVLYQYQGGKPKLIVYTLKRMSEVEKNYSITDLESCGLVINIVSFKHLLKKQDFDA